MWSGKVMRYAMQPGEEAEKRRPAGGGGAWRGGGGHDNPVFLRVNRVIVAGDGVVRARRRRRR